MKKQRMKPVPHRRNMRRHWAKFFCSSTCKYLKLKVAYDICENVLGRTKLYYRITNLIKEVYEKKKTDTK